MSDKKDAQGAAVGRECWVLWGPMDGPVKVARAEPNTNEASGWVWVRMVEPPPAGPAVEALERTRILQSTLCQNHCGEAAERGIHNDGCRLLVHDLDEIDLALRATLKGENHGK